MNIYNVHLQFGLFHAYSRSLAMTQSIGLISQRFPYVTSTLICFLLSKHTPPHYGPSIPFVYSAGNEINLLSEGCHTTFSGLFSLSSTDMYHYVLWE